MKPTSGRFVRVSTASYLVRLASCDHSNAGYRARYSATSPIDSSNPTHTSPCTVPRQLPSSHLWRVPRPQRSTRPLQLTHRLRSERPTALNYCGYMSASETRTWNVARTGWSPSGLIASSASPEGAYRLEGEGRARRGFRSTWNASTFQAWDDIVPPRIRISADGRMAYVVVQKRVHLTSSDSSGATVAERTRFAWLSVYEKQAGQWRLSAIASTERPDSL